MAACSVLVLLFTPSRVNVLNLLAPAPLACAAVAAYCLTETPTQHHHHNTPTTCSTPHQDVIESQIYPPLSNGFTDENAYIRELTLKSLLTLAPKMKQSTLTQNLLKHLSRLQVGG